MRGNVPSSSGAALLRPTLPGPTARRGRRWHPAALMTVPAMALLAVFVYWPLVRTGYLSTQGVNLFGEPTGFVRFRHYESYFASAANRKSLVVTLEFTALTIVFTLVPAIALTVFASAGRRAGALARIVFSLPFAYSASSASVLFAAIYNPATGILNVLLHKVGAGPVDWLGDPSWALVSVAIATAWWQIGFAVLVLTAAMRGVPEEVVEAARLDGAGPVMLRWRIILPLISPSAFFLLVTGSINGVQTFTQIAVLTRGGPSGATTTLVYDFYQRAFGNGLADYGQSSAIAMILLLLVIGMTAFQFGVLERRVHYR